MKTTITMFDQMFFELECPNAKCGKQIKEVLSQFRDVDEIACPHCSVVVNLKADSIKGSLDKLFDTATELDKQARQRGEFIKRF